MQSARDYCREQVKWLGIWLYAISELQSSFMALVCEHVMYIPDRFEQSHALYASVFFIPAFFLYVQARKEMGAGALMARGRFYPLRVSSRSFPTLSPFLIEPSELEAFFSTAFLVFFEASVPIPSLISSC